MSEEKKATFANNGYEISNGYLIRQIKIIGRCCYYQVDLGRVFGKYIRRNFINAKQARSFASKARTKGVVGGIKVLRFTAPPRPAVVKEDLQTPPKIQRTPKIYSLSDVRRIMSGAQPKLIPYLALGMFGGLRPAEILRLRWSDVDFEQAQIRVNTDQSTKASEGRIIHMHPNLAQFLLPFRGKKGALVVPYGQRNLQRWTRKLFRELDIQTIYLGARHTFAVFHLALHPLDETKQELGHSRRAMLLKYYRRLANRRKVHASKYFAIAPRQADIIPLKKEAA